MNQSKRICTIFSELEEEMTKDRQKKIDKMSPKMRQELLSIVQDIISLNLSGYEIVSIQ